MITKETRNCFYIRLVSKDYYCINDAQRTTCENCPDFRSESEELDGKSGMLDLRGED